MEGQGGVEAQGVADPKKKLCAGVSFSSVIIIGHVEASGFTSRQGIM
jgi:hypothetical protein